MKKQLESELISIAHRILKLTGKEDLNKMQHESALLYQKITVLKFLEDQNGELSIESLADNTSFFETIDANFNNKISDAVEVDDKVFVNIDASTDDGIIEPAIEKIKDIVAQMPHETAQVDQLIENTTKTTTEPTTEQQLKDLAPSYSQLPIFDPVEESPSEPQNKLDTPEEPLTASTSLNDQLKTRGFQVGLNDRLAFVKHLFENSNEEYDRVISQLSTLDSYKEATSLLEDIIKPDYNNWEGKEEYEARFMEIIEGRFN